MRDVHLLSAQLVHMSHTVFLQSIVSSKITYTLGPCLIFIMNCFPCLSLSWAFCVLSLPFYQPNVLQKNLGSARWFSGFPLIPTLWISIRFHDVVLWILSCSDVVRLSKVDSLLLFSVERDWGGCIGVSVPPNSCLSPFSFSSHIFLVCTGKICASQFLNLSHIHFLCLSSSSWISSLISLSSSAITCMDIFWYASDAGYAHGLSMSGDKLSHLINQTWRKFDAISIFSPVAHWGCPVLLLPRIPGSYDLLTPILVASQSSSPTFEGPV